MPDAQNLSDLMSVGLWMDQHKGQTGLTTPYTRDILGLPKVGSVWMGDHWESSPAGPPSVAGGGFSQALRNAPVGISLAGYGQLQGWTKDGNPIFNGQIYPWSSVKVDPADIEQATKRWNDQQTFHKEHPELYPAPAAPVAGKPELANISYSGDPKDLASHHVDITVSHDTPLGTWIQGRGQLEGWDNGNPIISGKTVPLSDVSFTWEKAANQYAPWQVQGKRYFATGPWNDPKYWTADSQKYLYNGKAPDPWLDPNKWWNFINTVVPEYGRQTGSQVTVPTMQSTGGYPWTPPANYGLPKTPATSTATSTATSPTAPSLPIYNAATLPTATRNTMTGVTSRPPSPFRPQRFTPERDYQPFPVYNRIRGFRQ